MMVTSNIVVINVTAPVVMQSLVANNSLGQLGLSGTVTSYVGSTPMTNISTNGFTAGGTVSVYAQTGQPNIVEGMSFPGSVIATAVANSSGVVNISVFISQSTYYYLVDNATGNYSNVQNV